MGGPKFRQKPEMQVRPEIARKPEVEIPAEIPTPTHVTHGFGSDIPDCANEEMHMDKPETVPTFVFPVRPETPSKTTEKPETTPVT